MMAYYYVKTDLYGVQKGRVERFADHKAGSLVRDGSIEPYDPKRHGHYPGAPEPEKKLEPIRAKA